MLINEAIQEKYVAGTIEAGENERWQGPIAQ